MSALNPTAVREARDGEPRNEPPDPPAAAAPRQSEGYHASLPASEGAGSPAPQAAFDFLAPLNAAREAAYHWDIQPDAMVWSPNTATVIPIADLGVIRKGAAFNMLIDADHAERRYRAIAGSSACDEGEGVRYRVQYRLKPQGRRQAASLWIEEEGRWYAGPAGEPQRAGGVLRVIDDRFEEDERLRFLSHHDDLTGHINRTRLTEELDALLQSVDATQSGGAFLMASVNNLSHINTTYGVGIGDEVISIVGRRMETCLRQRDRIGRYGSNKFGILLTSCTAEELVVIASRLLKSVRGSIIETSAGALSTNVCLGAVLIPLQAKTVQHAFNCSLEALDWARAQRASGFAVFKPSQARENQRQRNRTIADDVLRSLKDDRICMSLQPVVRMTDRRPAFHECLLCMRKPDGGVITANDFVPVAEELGLVQQLDRRALELAIAYLKAVPDITLSLNVSAQTTAGTEWLTRLCRLTANQRALNERLIVEITETAALHEIDESINFVDGLKHLGCRVAIDDFGAGYSNFKNLRMLDIDIIKIDGSFVKNIAESPDDQVFVRMLVELANIFGMEVVAEWVGDEATAVYLQKAGVTYMQGYLFGEPQMVKPAGATPPPAG